MPRASIIFKGICQQKSFSNYKTILEHTLISVANKTNSIPNYSNTSYDGMCLVYKKSSIILEKNNSNLSCRI